MPVYEYLCPDCKTTLEELRPMRDADAQVTCSKCGSVKAKRVHSVFAAAASSSGDTALPMAGCGRCGDPNGSCPYQ